MRRTGWLIVATALFSLPPGANGDTKEEKLTIEKLVGTWKMVSVEKGGQRKGEDDLKDQEVTIARDKLTMKNDAGTFVMKYELDRRKTPVRIKLTMTESPFGAGATANGIIEIHGDELKLCYATSGEAPEGFRSNEGSEHRLVVLKRMKKK